MKEWLVLGATILSEVVGSLSLKGAQTHPAWFVLVVIGYVGAFVLLSYLLRLGMPVGVAYGIWAAAGVVLTAVFSALIFGESITAPMVAGMGLIVVGVLAVELGSQRASAGQEAQA